MARARRRIQKRRIGEKHRSQELDADIQWVMGILNRTIWSHKAPPTDWNPRWINEAGFSIRLEWLDKEALYLSLIFRGKFRDLASQLHIAVDGRHVFRLDKNGDSLLENIRPGSRISYGLTDHSVREYVREREPALSTT